VRGVFGAYGFDAKFLRVCSGACRMLRHQIRVRRLFIMHRRSTFLVLTVLAAVALAATACSKSSPSAPTAVSTQSQGSATAFDATTVGGATGVTALPRSGAVDVKGLVKGVDFGGHTFLLVARNEREVTVRVTQKTVFVAGPNARAKLNFQSLKPGMAVDVVGRVERDVLVAASVVLLRPRPGV
jgi:hypothetical protein